MLTFINQTTLINVSNFSHLIMLSYTHLTLQTFISSLLIKKSIAGLSDCLRWETVSCFWLLPQNETSHKHFCFSFPQVSLRIFHSIMILITKRVSCFFVLYASSPKMVSHNSRMGIEVFYSAKIQFLTLSPLRVTSIQFLSSVSTLNQIFR